LRFRFAHALAFALIAAGPGAAHAQTEVTTTLMPGGGPLMFAGRVKYSEADRYYVFGRRDARLTARLMRSHSRLVIVFVAGNLDLQAPQRDWIIADTETLERTFPADGRYTVAVMFDPRVDFAVPPQPASYRLELKMEME
jgi:hypothetical protein